MAEIRCRNCGAFMHSTDFRYECPLCGFRYIIFGDVMIEPERQRPAGMPPVSIQIMEDVDGDES